ncbi:hypothetical protein QYQ98_04910 [Corynebacterium sp. P3-F1]|uniref:hypothetical protein n=1 Tax=Corynebacterium sp. P3-F1 TaxID=3059080 RepID=UPI00265C8F4D|nr:hypothetical protein [Corynebacterium sp. P3-F1]WKK62208.1 hypothetical protein QYQ98_04910 [Corynebacterium sp. P3-F1]
MGYLLLALSALALAGAGILWRADTQEKNAQDEDRADRGKLAGDAPFAAPEPAQASAQEAAMPEPEAAEATAAPTPPAVPEATDAAEVADAADANDAREEREAEATTAAPKEPAEAADRREQRPREKTHSRWGALSGAISGALPGAKQRGRKERREWAEANGFEYAKEDEFLQDEWGRGAASAGEPVRDVLTGTRFGHETRIADIGETTVVAMGTGMDSGVVVDVRRKANAHGADPAEDLVAVAELEGFRVFASEAGPAERMLDIRVSTALEMLPEQVSAVWFETEWVLAQLDGVPDVQGWEPVFAPLALLADAARTLPPRTWPHLHFDQQTREMGDPVEAPASADGDDAEFRRPVVARPEEPLELPTRITGTVHGTIEYRTLGGDEVDAIATGEPPEQLNDGTRLTRRPQPPSIFDDGVADYPG